MSGVVIGELKLLYAGIAPSDGVRATCRYSSEAGE